MPAPPITAPIATIPAQGNSALPDALEKIERDTIQKALKPVASNKTKAAAHLGITFRALRYKLRKLEMATLFMEPLESWASLIN